MTFADTRKRIWYPLYVLHTRLSPFRAVAISIEAEGTDAKPQLVIILYGARMDDIYFL